jgi:hypothetical protein
MMLPSLHVIEAVVSSGLGCSEFFLNDKDSCPPVMSWFKGRPGGVGGVGCGDDGVVFIPGLSTKVTGPSERLFLMVRLKLLLLLDVTLSSLSIISWFKKRSGGVGGVGGGDDGVVFILELRTKFIGPSDRLFLMVRLKLIFLFRDMTVSFSSIISIISWFGERPGGVGGVGGGENGVVFILEFTKFNGPSERLFLMVRLKLLFPLLDVTVSPPSLPTLLMLSLLLVMLVIRLSISFSECIVTSIDSVVCDP